MVSASALGRTSTRATNLDVTGTNGADLNTLAGSDTVRALFAPNIISLFVDGAPAQ